MKATLKFITLAVALCVGLFSAIIPTVNAADDHGHSHVATPKGGRLLDKTSPLAELVIEKDRTVTINFYTADLKPVAVTTQTVTVIADARDGKATLKFEKKDDSLVSKTKLPDGEGYNIVVQFRQAADAKPMNLRFKLDLSVCGGCKRAEYGCTCGH